VTYYAIRTSPQREFALSGRYDDKGQWVPGILERKGLSVFCPTETKQIRKNRYAKKKTAVTYPMFTGYVFIRAGFSWMHLLAERHVIGVVGFDGTPAQISDAEIKRLMAMSGASVPHRRAVNTRKSFMVGDLVEIQDGPFSGQIVKVEGLSEKKAKILINMFGTNKLVEIATASLEAA